MEPKHMAMAGIGGMLVCVLSMSLAACDPALNGTSSSDQSSAGQGSESAQKGSNTDTTDAQRLPCRNAYSSNTTVDECGLRLQEQTVVEATLSNPTKIYSEFDSVTSLLNSTPNCAAERCAQPVPASTKVQVICFEGDRFGIVAPQEHIIDQAHVTRYTTSTVAGKHLPGFEGKGTGVPIGFIDHSDIANLDEVSGELDRKMNDRFGGMSCNDQRIVVTDNMHRHGWNEPYSAKTPKRG